MKKEFGDIPSYHAFLKQYQAKLDRSTSDDSRHIFYSRPTGKWLKAVPKGKKITVTFHNECPCAD